MTTEAEAMPTALTPPELEEAIKHVTAFDDCQVGMLEYSKLWRLVVAARQYIWMLQRTEELHRTERDLLAALEKAQSGLKWAYDQAPDVDTYLLTVMEDTRAAIAKAEAAGIGAST